MFGCDGEDMFYKNKITFDSMKGSIEICFDSDSYFKEYEWFTATTTVEVNKSGLITEQKIKDDS